MKMLAVFLAVLPVQAAAQTSPIDLDHARTYFRELEQLGIADGGALWGRTVAGPMLFADRATRVVVANMPDLEGRLRPRGSVWVGELPPEQNVANTSISWGGRRWAMIAWPLPDSRYARGRLLMHESYHRLQEELGLAGSDRPNAHLGSASGRIWMRLEFRALAEALLRDGGERRQALADALTFRARRRAESKDAAEDERQLELNEGLAEYTGFVLSGLPRTALDDRVAVQLAQYEQQDNLSRSFAYASGPAYALLLDAAGRPWRTAIRAASDLSALAGAAYGVAAGGTADSLIGRYVGERMVAEERAREAERVAARARLRAKLVDGPTLTLPVADEFRYSFDPNGAIPIDGVGTAFESSRITDSWGVLTVKEGGVLLLRSPAGITGVVVPAPAGESLLEGEGWQLTLRPGWSVRPGPRSGDFSLARQVAPPTR